MKNIYKMGYFEDIRVEAEESEGGKAIVFHVMEKPTVRQISFSGNKVFITWGDHDVADNIVHLVLARLPDAPERSSLAAGAVLGLLFTAAACDNSQPEEFVVVEPGGLRNALDSLHVAQEVTDSL